MNGRILLGVAIAASLLLRTGSVAAQTPPTITHAVPAALAPEMATDVTLFGKDLAGVSAIWQSVAGEGTLAPEIPGNGQQPGFVRARFTLPRVGCGLVGLRVATGGGVSNLLLMLVDDLPSVIDAKGNISLATAQQVELPRAVDGFCTAEAAHYYKFTATKGERFAVEVFARRLGSPLDPVVRLLDAEGRELLYCDDEPGLAGDCRFAFTFPADGTYLLELRDIRYAGGEAYRFRLRLGNFPMVSGAYPPVVSVGATSEVVHVGPEGDIARQGITVALGSPVQRLIRSVKRPTDTGSGMSAISISELPQALESEPNDGPDQASKLAVDSGISGRFEQPKDVDRFAVAGNAGERIVITWQTQPVGSPAELLVQALAADGRLLVESNPGDAVHEFAFDLPADGRCTLAVSELHGRSGPQFTYHLAARRPEPQFELALDRDRASVPHGGAMVLQVSAVRKHFEGPISLALAGPDGQPLADAALAGQTIAADQSQTKLTVTLPPSLAPGTLRQLKVVGTSEVAVAGSPRTIRATATVGGALRKQNELLAFVPAELEEPFLLGVGPAFPQYFELALEPAEVLLPRLVNASSLKIKTKRAAGFNGEISLAIEGLPAGVEAKPVMLGQGVNEISIALSGQAELPLGETPIRVVGTATYQDQPKALALATKLRRIEPIRALITPAGALAIEGMQKVKVSVERFTTEKGPVAVTFEKFPEGVTGPASAEIPEGHDGVEIELAANLTAKPGKDQPLACTAKTRVMGEELTVASEPATLEVVDGK